MVMAVHQETQYAVHCQLLSVLGMYIYICLGIPLASTTAMKVLREVGMRRQYLRHDNKGFCNKGSI